MADEMAAEMQRMRREPPIYFYRTQEIVILPNPEKLKLRALHYQVWINRERLRAATDIFPLEFVSYAYAKQAAEKAIDDAYAKKKVLPQ